MITIIIIAITCVVSLLAFNSSALMSRFDLRPYLIDQRKQYYRIITHGFLHADWVHLFVNMFVLYSFGTAVEYYFSQFLPYGSLNYLLLYFGAMASATATTIKKYKNNFSYTAVGASGAVSAVVFASIVFDPWNKIYLFAIIPIPGIVFGFLYMLYSNYMSRKSLDNVNHEAHFLGALFGFMFPMVIESRLLSFFIQKLMEFNI